MGLPLMAWIAGLLTLIVGVAAFVCGFRLSARWFKSEPAYRLADQADSLPDVAGLVGALLPRSLKSIWVGLCIAAGIGLSGAFFFAAIAYGDFDGPGLVLAILISVGCLVFWAGMMLGVGAACRRMGLSRN